MDAHAHAAQWKLEANNTSSNQVQERKVRPQQQALNCPRCNSTNTKFCYYNNYSLTQPRYLCKACRRYWTQGGSLRNVPVGGGSRKNKTSSSSIPKPIETSPFSSQNLITHKPQHLNLGFQTTQEEYHPGFSQFLKLPKIETSNTNHLNFLSSSSSASSSTSCNPTSLSAHDLLRTGIISGGLNSFNTTIMPNSNAMFSRTGFSLQESKPTMGLPFHDNGIKYGGFQEYQEDGGRIMLPFGVLNQQLLSARESGQNMRRGDSTGYWNGTLGGGSS